MHRGDPKEKEDTGKRERKWKEYLKSEDVRPSRTRGIEDTGGQEKLRKRWGRG